jgi:hypothetical protein
VGYRTFGGATFSATPPGQLPALLRVEQAGDARRRT